MECDLEATIMSFYRACKVGEFETAFGVLHLVKDPRSSEVCSPDFALGL